MSVYKRTQQYCPVCHRTMVDPVTRFVTQPIVKAEFPDKTCARCARISDYEVKRSFSFNESKTSFIEKEEHTFKYNSLDCTLKRSATSLGSYGEVSGTWVGICVGPDVDIPKHYYSLSVALDEEDKRQYMVHNTVLDPTFWSREYALKKVQDLTDQICYAKTGDQICHIETLHEKTD